MQAALKLKTTVLPGKRIEVTVPELAEGEEVELIVMLPEREAEAPRQFESVIDFLNSLKPVQRTPEEWAEVEREFQEERNSWDF